MFDTSKLWSTGLERNVKSVGYLYVCKTVNIFLPLSARKCALVSSSKGNLEN